MRLQPLIGSGHLGAHLLVHVSGMSHPLLFQDRPMVLLIDAMEEPRRTWGLYLQRSHPTTLVTRILGRAGGMIEQEASRGTSRLAAASRTMA